MTSSDDTPSAQRPAADGPVAQPEPAGEPEPAGGPELTIEPDPVIASDPPARRVVRRRDPTKLAEEERTVLRRYAQDRPPHHSSDWG